MVIKKNEILNMQIWNNLPKYVLKWKKCAAYSCENVWGGTYKGVCHNKEVRHTQTENF